MQRFMTMATLVVACCLLVPSALAQPGGGRGFRGGGGGLFGGGGTLGLLQQRDVQSELELNEDQADELRAVGDELRGQMRTEMQDIFRGMRDLSDEERRTQFGKIRARMEIITKETQARVQQILLPHQFERLNQINLQTRIQRGGAAALTEGELADTLGLTEAQREQLRERAEQVEQDLQKKIRQLRVDARNQLLDVLTAKQRAQLESMLGPNFESQQPGSGWRGGRTGFGGRGGFGDRGGRDRGQGSNAPPPGTI